MHMHAWTAAYPTAAAEHAPTHAGVGFALCSLRQHGALHCCLQPAALAVHPMCCSVIGNGAALGVCEGAAAQRGD